MHTVFVLNQHVFGYAVFFAEIDEAAGICYNRIHRNERIGTTKKTVATDLSAGTIGQTGENINRRITGINGGSRLYKIVLLDDEPMILEGLKSTFPWREYGMTLSGAFTKATEALDFILRTRPDAVFTDIRMPVISGIELVRQLRDRGYDTEVLIISGYDQFEYARDAVRLGAFDYCLKPIDTEITGQVLERLKERLDRKNRIRNNYMLELLAGDASWADSNPLVHEIPDAYPYYQVLCLSQENPEDEVERAIAAAGAEDLRFDMKRNSYYLINTQTDLGERFLREGWLLSMAEHGAGISTLTGSISDIPTVKNEADMAFWTSYASGNPARCRYHPPRYAQLNSMIERAVHLLNEGNRVALDEMIDRFTAEEASADYTVQELQYLWNQMILRGKRIYSNDDELTSLLCSDWRDLTERFSSIAEYAAGLKKLFAEGIQSPWETEQDKDEGMESTASQIIQYLNANYASHIQLMDLASRFHISRNYASVLIKKYTDMTFSEYLNSLRLARARKLLSGTSQSISEVAEHAGYEDYFYFSKLFKKTFGVTPAQYRRNPF